MHEVLQQDSEGTTQGCHANLDHPFSNSGYVSSGNVTGTSTEYYNGITSAAQSDCLTSVIRTPRPRPLPISNWACKHVNTIEILGNTRT